MSQTLAREQEDRDQFHSQRDECPSTHTPKETEEEERKEKYNGKDVSSQQGCLLRD